MDTKDSLVLRAQQQLDLIASSDMPDPVFADTEKAGVGEFTGARLFAQDPDRYKMICSLLAEGIGLMRIGKLLKVSPHTVAAIRDREPVLIDIAKKQIARAARTGAQLCLETIMEALVDEERRKKISARDLGVLHGILIDKSQLLDGEPTQIHDTSNRKPTDESFQEYLLSLRPADIDVIGLGGEAAQQKEEVIEATVVPADGRGEEQDARVEVLTGHKKEIDDEVGSDSESDGEV